MPLRRSCHLPALAAAAAFAVGWPSWASAQGACAPPIAETRAIVESDIATGNLNAPVGKRFRSDLDRAMGACAAGHDAEALRLLAGAKARYGYR